MLNSNLPVAKLDFPYLMYKMAENKMAAKAIDVPPLKFTIPRHYDENVKIDT